MFACEGMGCSKTYSIRKLSAFNTRSRIPLNPITVGPFDSNSYDTSWLNACLATLFKNSR